jgi:hypothetical protein
MLSLLGLPAPAEGDEVLEPPAFGGGMMGLNSAGGQTLSLNAAEARTDAEDEYKDYAGDFVEITDEVAEVLEKAADAATDFASFQDELKKLVTTWPPDKIARLLAVATFKKRADGNAEFED